MSIDIGIYTSLLSSKLKQEVLFRLLINNVPLSAVDIERKLDDVDISQISTVLKKLEMLKLIRCVNPNNMRNRFFELTSDGQEMIDTIIDQVLRQSLISTFENMGYEVKTKSLMFSQPVDMILSKKNETIYVDVKSEVIKERHINQLNEYTKDSTDRRIIISPKKVNEDIKELAHNKKVEIWDGKKLDELQGKILYPKIKK